MSAPPSDVEAVLAAIDKGALLYLLPQDQAKMLAGPVIRAATGGSFDEEARASASMLLDSARDRLAGPLLQMGLTIPDPAAPVVHARTTSAGRVKVTVKMIAIAGQARIAIFAPFTLKPLLQSFTGARWNGERRCWHVPASPAAAAEVLDSLAVQAPAVSPGVAQLAQEFATTRSARAVLLDGAPLPDGDLSDVVTVAGWDHQRRGVAFTEAARALLLAVPMGGGKTLMAIAGINRRQAATVIIVCPNAVRAVWPREVRERSAVSWHIEDGTRPSRVRGGKRQDLNAGERVERMQRLLWACDCGAPVHAFCINYEQLARPEWRRWRPRQKLDVIVYDEVHRLKSPTGVVSKTAAKWHGFAGLHIGLSGTPLPQTPLDAFGVMRALDPGLYGTTWTGFKNRYAVMDPTGTFPLTGRIQNGAELAEKFLSITYLPKVDLNLPPVVDVLRPVTLEPAARKAYNDLDEALWADLTPFMGKAPAGDPADLVEQINAAIEFEQSVGGSPAEITTPNILTKILREQQLTGGTLVDDDGHPHVVSTAKRDGVKAWLEDEVVLRRGSGDPVVMFCRFRSDLDVIEALAGELGVRYGEISGRRKDGLDADARMSAEVDLLAVQVQSGGTGIDLTRSRYGGWYSLGYSVSDYDQARKRLDRPGQTRSVTFAHFVVEDTADQAVYDAIDNRRAVISEVLRSRGVDPAALGIHEPAPPPREARDAQAGAGGAVVLPWD